MLNKWDVNSTDYPQVCNGALSYQREYEFMGAGCLDPFMLKVDRKIDKMMSNMGRYCKRIRCKIKF